MWIFHGLKYVCAAAQVTVTKCTCLSENCTLCPCHKIIYSWNQIVPHIFYSASVTAVFELGDGTVKRFTRIVQGSSSEHRINGEVINSNWAFPFIYCNNNDVEFITLDQEWMKCFYVLFVSFLQFIMLCSFGMYYDSVIFVILPLAPLIAWGKVTGTLIWPLMTI